MSDTAEAEARAKWAAADPLAERLATFLTLLRALEGERNESAVHDLRVASRRLREAARLLGGSKALRALERAARRVTRALGPAREREVTRVLLEREARGVDPEHEPRLALALDYLSWRAARRERRALGRGLRRVSRLRVRQRKRLAGAGPADPQEHSTSPWSDPARAGSIAAATEERARAVEARLAALGEGRDDERLHALRIAVKRLRYAVEIVSQGGATRARGSAAARALLAELKRLQERLGDHHDVVVALAWVEREQARLAAARRSLLGAAVDELAARLRSLAEARRQRAEKLVDGIHPGSTVRRVERLLAARARHPRGSRTGAPGAATAPRRGAR